MNGRGGGPGRRPRRDRIMDAIGAWIESNGGRSNTGSFFTPKNDGKGIAGHSSHAVTLTGGASYMSGASDWYINKQTPTIDYGNLPGYGVPQYIQPEMQQFQPATTILGSMYYMLNGIDPNTGEYIPPFGTPGTLKANLLGGMNISQEFEDKNAGHYSQFVGGVGPDAIPSGLKTRSFAQMPGWLQWYETHQGSPDLPITIGFMFAGLAAPSFASMGANLAANGSPGAGWVLAHSPLIGATASTAYGAATRQFMGSINPPGPQVQWWKPGKPVKRSYNGPGY